MNNKFADEVTKFTQGAILLPTELANIFEKQFGLEVGSRKNLEIVRLSLEQYIEQTTEAVSLLDNQIHMVAVSCLNNALGYFREALADVNRQLRSGDHLPENGS